MNYLKQIAAITIAVILTMSIFLVSGGVCADDTARYGRSILGKMDNATALQHIYDRLVKACDNTDEIIEINHKKYAASWDELTTVFLAVRCDYPEYFWLSGSFSGAVDGASGKVRSIRPMYTVTGNQLQSQKATFKSKAKEFINDLKGKSDYDKALILHDRLAEAITYSPSQINDQSGYGAIVHGKAVCAGYAKAYQYLLGQLGIASFCVTGFSTNPATGNPESHEWNLVNLDGKWYYTDITWDDQETLLFHSYFNITTKQLKEDHFNMDFEAYLPNATANAANYFAKNGRIYSAMSIDKLVTNLKVGGNKTSLFISGDVNEFKRQLNSQSATIAAKLGATGGAQYSISTAIIGRELQLSVNIIPAGHKHALTPVAGKNPSCTSTGHIAYYTCNCGKWFSDTAATKEITNKESITLEATSHTPSGWKSNTNDHWKVCTKCQAEIANSRSAHADGNKDGKCDICHLTFIIPSATGPATSANSPAITTASSSHSAPTGSNAATPDTHASSAPDAATPSDKDGEKDDSTHTSPNTTGETLQETTDGNHHDNNTLILIIAGGTLVAAGATIGIAIALRRKRK